MDKSKNSTPFSLSKAHFKNPHLTFQEVSVNFDENNFFNTKKEEVVPVIKEPKKPIKSTRLNDYDGNILSNVATIKPIRKTFKEKIEKVIKPKFQLQNLIPKSFEDLFALFLPSLYKSTKVRETLKRLKELNKIAHELATTKIPYGENKERYDELFESLKEACTIQTKLKKKIS
ncbi:hypothetical protein IJC60_03445 [bacterium]|nr:hypothetical protein [bacterium]